MKKFQDWRENINNLNEIKLSQNDFIDVCLEYFGSNLRGSMKTYFEYIQENLSEAVETSRYAIEVNYRTTTAEALEGFGKLVLGYVSAALKNYGYHTKHVFTEKPLRILVSSRNWDDGEIAGSIVWNHEHNCFILCWGFYNKSRKTITIQNSKKCDGDSAAELAKELHNKMNHLKNQPDKTLERMKLKAVPLKRGPKN